MQKYFKALFHIDHITDYERKKPKSGIMVTVCTSKSLSQDDGYHIYCFCQGGYVYMLQMNNTTCQSGCLVSPHPKGTTSYKSSQTMIPA